MGYRLEYADSARDYLRKLSLSRSGRLCVAIALIQLAMQVPDSFRLDPTNRLAPPLIGYQFSQIFLDNNHFMNLRVVVDDSTAAYGVLRIVYIDCQ